ncbi:MAG: helix-turn-helix transcriptional regulator [Thiotrichaceae bacterium]
MTLKQKISFATFSIIISVYSLYEVSHVYNDAMTKNVSIWHLATEVFIVIISFSAVIYFSIIINRQYKAQLELEENLDKVRTQLESSNIRIREGKKEYQKVIQWQFKEWGLTPSEREVALMMLKGLSIKEISKCRSTHEKTVRKQASAVYEKSNLKGRHELSAWFFEDLL